MGKGMRLRHAPGRALQVIITDFARRVERLAQIPRSINPCTASAHLPVQLLEKLRIERGALIDRTVERPRRPRGPSASTLRHTGKYNHPRRLIGLSDLLLENLRPDGFGGGQNLCGEANRFIVLR